MSQNKDIICKLRDLVELRQNTIIANKKAMKGYLIDYKKSLELDKKIKNEIRTLNTAINLLQYGKEDEIDKINLRTLENSASNKEETIYSNDEE